jgi:hypothetical protein
MRKYLLRIFFKPVLNNFEMFLIICLLWGLLADQVWWSLFGWTVGMVLSGCGEALYNKYGEKQ